MEENQIDISGLKSAIDVRQLKKITISNDHILFINIKNEMQRVGNLNLDPESAKNILNYLNKTTLHFDIVNNAI